MLDGASVLDESDGTVRINVPHPDIPDSMVHYLAETLGTAFSRHLGRDVRAEMIREDDQQQRQQPHDAPREGEDESGNSPASEPGPSAAQPAPRFSVVDGLTNSQVWAAAQEDLRGRMSAANFETWLRPASLIGRDEHGSLVLGVPNRFAQQRVQAKLKDDIEAVLSRIVGGPVTVRIVVGQQWLRENRQP